MVDAGIEDLSNDPEGALQKVEQRFHLELSDEEAEHLFLGLIDESISALFPRLMERVHQVAVSLR